MSLGCAANWQGSVVPRQPFHNEASDETSAQNLMAGLYVSHDLKVGKPGRMHFRHTESFLYSKAVSLGYLEYGTDVTVEIDDLSHCYSISLPTHGTQQLSHCGDEACSDKHQAVIISPSSPASLLIRGDCKKRIVRIEREALERQLATLLRRPITEPIIFDIQMDASSGKSASWWRTVAHFQEELGHTKSMFMEGPYLQQAEQILITGLLYAQRHNYSSEFNDRTKLIAPVAVQRAESFMRKNIQESVTLEQLVEAARVSKNTLYSDFKRFYRISPMGFLRNLRMDEARLELLERDINKNVTSVALTWGFNHLGRFAMDYKKRYGESPSDTLGADSCQTQH